jgi:flagellar biosynthesis protein FlhA
VDALELELALDLIDLVGDGGDLLDRVKGLRRKIAGDLGLIVPPVRTRDNLDLAQGTYSIRLHGVEAGRGMAPQGRLLCIGDGIEALPGESTVEPVFGLAAKWVPIELRQQALMAGVTVVDRSSVITTHLGEVIADNAGRLLSTQQLRTLLDLVKEREPVVMEEMAAANLGLSELQRVLCELLNEGVPIRDLGRITEAVSERARVTKEPDALLEAARNALGPAITALYAEDGVLHVITIEAVDERMLIDAVTPGEGGLVLAIDPHMAERVATQASTLSEQAEQQGHQPVLLCSSRLRPALQRLLRGTVPRLHVIGVNEVASNVKLERLGTVHLSHEIAAA